MDKRKAGLSVDITELLWNLFLKLMDKCEVYKCMRSNSEKIGCSYHGISLSLILKEVVNLSVITTSLKANVGGSDLLCPLIVCNMQD